MNDHCGSFPRAVSSQTVRISSSTQPAVFTPVILAIEGLRQKIKNRRLAWATPRNPVLKNKNKTKQHRHKSQSMPGETRRGWRLHEHLLVECWWLTGCKCWTSRLRTLGAWLIPPTTHLGNCSFEEPVSTGVCLSFSDQVLGLLLKPSTPPQDHENRRSYSGYVCFSPPSALERRLNHAMHSVMLSTRRQATARKVSPASVSQQYVWTGSLGSLMMPQQRTLTH